MKILLRLTMISGIIILLIGFYLRSSNESSSGFTYSRNGSAGDGTINDLSCFFIGILLLSLSVWIFKLSKNQEKYRREKRQEEDKEFSKKTHYWDSKIKKEH